MSRWLHKSIADKMCPDDAAEVERLAKSLNTPIRRVSKKVLVAEYGGYAFAPSFDGPNHQGYFHPLKNYIGIFPSPKDVPDNMYFMVLHELGHAVHNHSSYSGISKLTNEFEAWAWASKWVSSTRLFFFKKAINTYLGSYLG